MLNRISLIILTIVFITGCRLTPELESTSRTTAARLSPPARITFVGDSNTYPENCRPEEVAALILRYFDAYNTGNEEQLVALFESQFNIASIIGWYSDSFGNTLENQHHFTASSREELLTYVRKRHQQHEQLQLLTLSVGLSWHSGVDINFVFSRQADDLHPGYNGVSRIGSGKGAILCPEQKISIWSMGTYVLESDEAASLYACDNSQMEPLSDELIVCGQQALGE